jgi:hypothetical protein
MTKQSEKRQLNKRQKLLIKTTALAPIVAASFLLLLSQEKDIADSGKQLQKLIIIVYICNSI